MTSFQWQWISAIVPVIGDDFFRQAAFRSIAFSDSDLTSGGVVSRLVKLSEESLFVLVTPSAVVACRVSPAAALAVSGILEAHASPVTIFTPGEVDYGAYPLFTEGVGVFVSCLENGQQLLSTDPRRIVLSPALPRFTASSVINRVGDAFGPSDYFLTLDQVTGAVSILNCISSSMLSNVLAVDDVTPLAAFHSIPKIKA